GVLRLAAVEHLAQPRASAQEQHVRGVRAPELHRLRDLLVAQPAAGTQDDHLPIARTEPRERLVDPLLELTALQHLAQRELPAREQRLRQAPVEIREAPRLPAAAACRPLPAQRVAHVVLDAAREPVREEPLAPWIDGLESEQRVLQRLLHE